MRQALLVALVAGLTMTTVSTDSKRGADAQNLAIQRLTQADFIVLTNPGVQSVQLMSPRNAPQARVTVTRVTMQPGSTQTRLAHKSEQVWIVEKGAATVLLAGNKTQEIQVGEVLRTPPEQLTAS
jgi:mannose-6-phosphate isomerase-like protein (cupin superfamily)